MMVCAMHGVEDCPHDYCQTKGMVEIVRFTVWQLPISQEDEGRRHLIGSRDTLVEATALRDEWIERSGGYLREGDLEIVEERPVNLCT
jgi:hypothetical protein